MSRSNEYTKLVLRTSSKMDRSTPFALQTSYGRQTAQQPPCEDICHANSTQRRITEPERTVEDQGIRQPAASSRLEFDDLMLKASAGHQDLREQSRTNSELPLSREAVNRLEYKPNYSLDRFLDEEHNNDLPREHEIVLQRLSIDTSTSRSQQSVNSSSWQGYEDPLQHVGAWAEVR